MIRTTSDLKKNKSFWNLQYSNSFNLTGHLTIDQYISVPKKKYSRSAVLEEYKI